MNLKVKTVIIAKRFLDTNQHKFGKNIALSKLGFIIGMELVKRLSHNVKKISE